MYKIIALFSGGQKVGKRSAKVFSRIRLCCGSGRLRNLSLCIIMGLEMRILPQNNGRAVITITPGNFCTTRRAARESHRWEFQHILNWHNIARNTHNTRLYHELNKYINHIVCRKEKSSFNAIIIVITHESRIFVYKHFH